MIRDILKFYHCTQKEHPLSPSLSLHCNLSRNVISQFLNLIDCPIDGRCLIYMQKTCGYLLSSFYEEHHDRTPTTTTETQRLIWEAVKAESITNDLFLKKSMPTKSDNPIYTFHFEVCPSTPSNPEFKALNERTYRVLAAFLHKRMNHWFQNIEQERPGIDTKQYSSHLGLAARKSVRGFLGDTSKSGFHFTRLERALLPEILDESVTSIGKKLLATGDKSYLKDLFTRNHRRHEGRDFTEREFNNRIKRWLTEPYSPTISTIEQNYQVKPTSPFKLNTKTSNDEETTINFYTNNPSSKSVEETNKTTITIPPEWTQTGWEQKRRTVGIIENTVQAFSIQPWDSRCISLKGLRSIYHHLILNEQISPKIRFIILMSLFIGISRLSLINIGYMKVPRTIDDRGIDMEAVVSDRIWLDTDLNLIWWFSGGSSGRDAPYYQVEYFREIRLPNIISDTFNLIPDNERLIYKKDFTTTTKVLARIGTDGLTNITTPRLTLTFRAYFINGAGFPSIFADFIIGRKSSHLLSQHSYITTPLDYIIEEWHRMCSEFLTGLSSSEPLESTLTKMRHKPLKLSNIEKYENSVFIGSPLTPKTKTIQQHLRGLYIKFPHDAAGLLLSNDNTWNYYIAYLYTFFALCTGQRPNHSPMPLQKLINFPTKTAYVSDKNNRFYKEHREIFLAPSLIKLLKAHKGLSNSWVIKKRTQGYTLDGSLDSFLIADANLKKLIPVSPKKLDELLVDQPTTYFFGLANGCRHLLLSTLNWNGTPQEYIDFISGHRHVGFEPSHICSPISAKRVGIHLAEIIETKLIPLFDLKQPIKDSHNE